MFTSLLSISPLWPNGLFLLHLCNTTIILLCSCRVKFREDEPLKALDSSTQSGGERSVSTMLYLISLQVLIISCPWICISDCWIEKLLVQSRIKFQLTWHSYSARIICVQSVHGNKKCTCSDVRFHDLTWWSWLDSQVTQLHLLLTCSQSHTLHSEWWMKSIKEWMPSMSAKYSISLLKVLLMMLLLSASCSLQSYCQILSTAWTKRVSVCSAYSTEMMSQRVWQARYFVPSIWRLV